MVTAFILMSDVKDEIDFEFVGTDLEAAQSNFYFQGIPDCESLGKHCDCIMLMLDKTIMGRI